MGVIVEPVENTNNQAQDVKETSVRPSVSSQMVQEGVVLTKSSGRLFLFQYVTALASGLILLGIVSLVGFSLLNHWLGEPSAPTMFSGFEYYYHLYLLVSLGVFGALHVWMSFLVGRVAEEDQPSSVRVFRAIFLTILTLTVISSVGAMVYVGVDTLLGTGDYSMKSTWLIMLDALQVIAWAVLLWWYFKRPHGAVVYSIAATVVLAVMVVLLVVLPILAKRDAVIDARTSNDLSAITTKISEYTRKNNKLPGSLSDVKLDDKVAARVGQYEYQPGQAAAPKSAPTTFEDYLSNSSSSSSSNSSFSYKLCATFKTDTAKNEDDTTFLSYFSGSGASKHPSGRHCADHVAYGSGDGSSVEPSDPLQSILNAAGSSPASY